MTSYIAKFATTIVTTLAISPLVFSLNINFAQAELNERTAVEIKNATTKINNINLPTSNKIGQVERDNDAPAQSASGNREKSMEYLKMGIEAENDKNPELALANYYTAAKTDPTNGHAFLFAGKLIGNSKTGIDSLQVAIHLFKEENDTDCLAIAMELLQSFYASN
jgi:hypothetical protein